MDDDKLDASTNGNIPISPAIAINEDANRTMTPLVVTSDDDSFEIKSSNKNFKISATTKKDIRKDIQNLEDDIEEIFGEREKLTPKTSKIKNQRKSIGSTGSSSGGGIKSAANKNAKSPTRTQKQTPATTPTTTLGKTIKSEILSTPSTSNLISKRCNVEIEKFLSAPTPSENEFLYGYDENGEPVYGKKIKGENDDDDENVENLENDEVDSDGVKNQLLIIEKPTDSNEKVTGESIIKSPKSNLSNPPIEMEITEEETKSNIENIKDDSVDNKQTPLTPPPILSSALTAPTTTAAATESPPILTSSISSSASKLKPSEDPIYRKPFEMGWKREIVLRALPGSKDKGEVYYITPNGKKLRTRNEIQNHLTIGLTLDNFTFSKDPLGAGPDEEIIRSAKITGRTSTDIVLGKRIPKPKAPKGASPPPQPSQSSTAQKSLNKSTTDRHHHHNSSSSSASPRTISNARISEDSSKSSSKIATSKSNKKGEPCTIQCLPALGMIPQLQCIKCLCLYHHECVGLDRLNDYHLNSSLGCANNDEFNRKDYECASCKNQPSTIKLIQPNTTTSTAIQNSNNSIKFSGNIRNPSNKNPKHQQKSNNNSDNGSGSNGNNNPNTQQQNSITNDLNIEKSSSMPQSIAVLNGRKYLVIRKPAGVSSTGIEQHDSTPSSSGTLQTGDSSSKKRTGGYSGIISATQPNKIQKVDTFANNFFGNVSLGYDVLLEIFQYLKVQELLRAACVCRVWNVVANHRSLWKTVRMKNSQVNDWAGLAASLRRNETQHLDLRKMLCLNSTEEQMWLTFAEHIKSVITLQKIDLGRCSANVVQNLFLTTPQLRYLNAISIRSDTLNLQNLNLMENLEELRLKTNDGCNLIGDLQPLELLINLRHLSLTSINELGLKNIDILGNLYKLESLEIGECSQIDESFAINILSKLINLERLRLEKSTEINVTFELLKTISKMKNLLQLELVNFDIRDGFEAKIIECKYLKRLLLIPTYISQSATTNQIILSSMRKLTTLDSLTWVVTMELLRVTSLYVDQCEEVTKGKKTFDESIPVLKPVPGTNYNEDEPTNKQTSEVQQVEILPLSKINEILADGMPTTKFKIVKVAFHATWRQNYVE